MKELADDISGATTSIVQRVLRQYGDPGLDEETDEQESESAEAIATDERADEDDSSSADDSATNASHSKSNAADQSHGSSDSAVSPDGVTFQVEQADYKPDSDNTLDRSSQHDQHSIPDLSQFTEKQRETLRAIRERPTATQAELADELGVASATINQRVNSIDGFDWSERHAFVDAVFSHHDAPESETRESNVERETDGGPTPPERTTDTLDDSTKMKNSKNNNDTGRTGSSANSDAQHCEDINGQVDELSKQVEALEQRVETQSPSTGFSDPELAHKVVHACVTSDNISEEEELEILKTIID